MATILIIFLRIN